ncbi:S-norcoclaurine synthase 1-like [Punica granatum]|uniref:Fe2OG dioxygenase domain-containing protein n=2 Tax=Punica granatum TaxID=22663 RepID=A0A218VUU5_PUNGR|nr:S-norcoclaurine synthase 1-like [Punica granatum]OWM64103.1 hypothetical protein CDL15_Pgr018674 [Punica granatum]PKI57178.1 hypothetical protein CRG98_022468 [Punica granatum]
METGVLNLSNFGGSLPVENVQDLAAKCSEEVPARYLRSTCELGEVWLGESLQIPIIDLSKLSGNQAEDQHELEKLHLACKEWGFFQLLNHGIPDEAILQMKNDTERFFKLPLEEKKAYAQLPNNIEGYGQAFVVSEDQKLDWGDMLFLLPQPVSQRNLQFWPNNPSSFKATLERYSSEIAGISARILRSMAMNLGVDPDKLVNMFGDGVQGIRMNYYPPCPQASRVMGLTCHSDATGLTLLVQANEVDGLQIKKNGNWLPIKPFPGAFIVNVGDVIEIMSNGEYRSIEHRAVVDPARERLSIAAFHSPNLTTVIGPLQDLTTQSCAQYRTLSHEEYIKLVISSKLDGKSLLDHIRI